MSSNNEHSNNRRSISDVLVALWGSSKRATLRFLKNLPSRASRYIKRKVKEYKNRPPRKDINKVYVLVGYTTKQHVDEKYNAEKNMIILRRGLLILMFVLLVMICINRFMSITNFDDIKQMFGINSWGEVVEHDPFSYSNETTVPSQDDSGIIRLE